MIPRHQDRWEPHGGGFTPAPVVPDVQDDDEEVWCG